MLCAYDNLVKVYRKKGEYDKYIILLLIDNLYFFYHKGEYDKTIEYHEKFVSVFEISFEYIKGIKVNFILYCKVCFCCWTFYIIYNKFILICYYFLLLEKKEIERKHDLYVF
ncbi:hypothetical protein RFI_40150 [Reticulomyxa filosa]|uniref:Uncharacterized protein n=1 Tax=Reticulomyxa filosa TaxID=46433 RepID=X6L9L0_RETFI|nr:hypothetical protein RFI_40150 [Reticulomyxa filosa]|eukprot:ETN97379.1 hypothetical protein RFI_40150 [Reticulomyxa filosa]